MTEKHINHVVAENLAHWMAEAKMTQTGLAERAGVSQKTISNYLNPDQRESGATGKVPSAKLTELDLIAKALNIQVWQLTRGMSTKERQLYESIERAYRELIASSGTVTSPEENAAEYERLKTKPVVRKPNRESPRLRKS